MEFDFGLADQAFKEKEKTEQQNNVGFNLDAANDAFAKREKVQENLNQAQSANPDDAAKVEDLSNKTGLPPDIVQHNRDDIERRRKALEVRNKLDEAPGTAKFLEKQKNAKIAHDAIDSMWASERVLRRGTARSVDVVAGVAEVLGKGLDLESLDIDAVGDFLERIIPLGQLTVTLKDGITWRPSTEEDIKRNDDWRRVTRFIKKVGSTIETGVDGTVLKPGTSWEEVKNSPVSNLLPFALEEGLVSVPDMAMTLLNLPMYMLGRTGVIGEERAKNQGRHEATVEDFVFAAPAAVGSALLERFSARGMFGLDDTVKRLRDVPKAAGKAMIKEAGTEFIQEAGESTAATLGTDKGFDIWKTLEAGLQGAVAGGPFGGMVRASTGTIQGVANSRRAKANQEFFEALGESEAANELRERMPEKERERVEDIIEANGGTVDTIYMDPKKAVELFQSDSEIWDSFEDSERVTLEESLRLSQQTGQPMAIPLSTYSAKMSHDPELANTGDISLESDGMTANQADEFNREVQQIFEAEREAQEAGEMRDIDSESVEAQIGEQIYEQSLRAGNSVTVARQHGDLHTAFARVIQQRFGRDPREFYNNLSIRSQLSGGLEASKFEIDDLVIERMRRGRSSDDPRLYGDSLMDFARREGINPASDRGDVASRDFDSLESRTLRLINVENKKTGRGHMRRILAPKLLREGGMNLDDIALRAQELGYFPERIDLEERIDINYFLDALDSDADQRFIEGDADQAEIDLRREAEMLEEELNRRGIDIDEDNEVIKAIMRGQAPVPGEALNQLDGSRFEKDLAKWQTNINQPSAGNRYLRLGRTFPILRRLGFNKTGIMMSSGKANRTQRIDRGVPESVWNNLPALVADPLIVMPDSRKEGNYFVVIDARSEHSDPRLNDQPIIVVVKPDGEETTKDQVNPRNIVLTVLPRYLHENKGAVEEKDLKPEDYIDGDEWVRDKLASAALDSREEVYVRDGLDTAEFERLQESPGNAAPRSGLRPSRGKVKILQRSDFDNVLYQSAQRNNIGLYSGVEQAALDMNIPAWKEEDGEASGKEVFQKIIKMPGVKKEEIKWLGLEDHLSMLEDNKPMKFTRDQVVRFIQNNGVQVVEEVGDKDPTDAADMQWDSIEFWDDPKAWEHDIEYQAEMMKEDPDVVERLRTAAADSVFNKKPIEERMELSKKFPSIPQPDGTLLRNPKAEKYLESEIDDELERIIEVHAERRAQEQYEADPYQIIRAKNDFDIDITLFGNDEIGWDIRVGNWRTHTSRLDIDPIYSRQEAKIQAYDYALNEGLLESEDSPNIARWGEAIMAGSSSNYREQKLTLPGIEGTFEQSAHFDDPNIVAFLRNDDRTLNNLHTYFIDEFQSDWHQQGRKYGYSKDLGRDEIGAINDTVESHKNDLFEMLDERDGDPADTPGYVSDENREKLRKLLLEAIDPLDAFKDGMISGDIDKGSYDLASDLSKKDALLNNVLLPLLSGTEIQTANEWIKGKGLTQFNQKLFFSKLKQFIKDNPDMSSFFDVVNQHAEMVGYVRAERLGPPEAPFGKDEWMTLGLKRAIVDAVDKGYDSIAWPNSQVLMDRWSPRYEELYVGQYDQKMPGIIKKLTGQEPKKYNADPLPMNEYNMTPDESPQSQRDQIYQGERRIDYEVAVDPQTGHFLLLENPVIKDGKLTGRHVLKNTDDTIKRFDSEESAGAELDRLNRDFDLLQDGKDKPFHKQLQANKRDLFTPKTQAYYQIEITPEMREQIKAESFSLFQNEGQKGSIQFLPDNNTIINLFEGADLSTPLHEFGHFFVNVLEQIGTQDGAPEAAVNDLNAMLKFVGANSASDMDVSLHGEAAVTKQEKLARAFEAYLREGKAPSVELQSAFAKFRAWLMLIYKSIRNLNVDLNDDIRGVFDRMLATEEQINEANLQREFKPSEQIMTLMDDQEREDHVAAHARAREAAIDELERRKIAELKREATSQWKGFREHWKKESTRIVDQMPIYQALKELNSKDGMKFSKTDLVEIFGAEILPRLKGKYRKTGGVSVRMLAEQFGFESSNDFIEQIINAAPRKEVIEIMTDGNMEAAHGDLQDVQRDAAEAAREAVMNDERGIFIATELNAIAKQTKGREATAASVAKESARRIIGEQRVDKVNKPATFLSASQRFAKEAERALIKKDFDLAYEAKRNQMLNHYLYLESVKARDLIAKKVKEFNKYNGSRAKTAKIDSDYVDKIRDLLSSYQFTPRQSRRTQMLEAARNIEAWAEQQNESSYTLLEIPPEILNVNENTHYRDMTFDEFRGLSDVIEHIAKQGRMKNKLLSMKDKIELDRLMADLEESIKANYRGKKHKRKKSLTGIDKTKENWFRRFSMRKVQFLAHELDGFKEGPVQDIIYRILSEAEVNYDGRKAKFAKEMGDLMKVYSGRELLTNNNKLIPVDGIDFEMTKNSILAVAFNVGNPDNKQKLMETHGWDQAQLDSILSHLDKRDWDFVQGVWDYYASFWNETVALDLETRGYPATTIEPEAVQTPYGTYKGGYYPIKYTGDVGGKADIRNTEELMREIAGAKLSRPTTNTSRTKERVGVGKDMEISLDFDHMIRELDKTMHDLSYRKAAIDLSKIINHPTFARAINESVGGARLQQIKDWVSDTVAGGMANGQPGPFDRIFGFLRRRTTAMTLGYKVSTFMLQPLGYTQTFARLIADNESNKAIPQFSAIKYLMKGLGDFFRTPQGMKQQSQFVYDRSPRMRERARTFDRDIHNNIEKIKQGPLAKYYAGFFYMTGAMQKSVDLPTWMAAYHMKMDEFYQDPDQEAAESRAIEYADSVVTMTQGSGLTSDLGAVQRGGEVQKTFTMYMTFFSVMHNMVVDEGKKTAQTVRAEGLMSKATFKRAHVLTSNLMLLIFVPANAFPLLFHMAGVGGPDEDDEENWDKGYLTWALKNSVTFGTAGIPFVRDIISGTVSDFPYQVSPVAGTIKKSMQVFPKVYDDIVNEELSPKTLTTIATAISLLPGMPVMPTSQIGITAEYLMDYYDGETDGFNWVEAFFKKDFDK